MGLNVNYSLLIEGNNSTSSIPKYTRYYTPGFIAESEFEACISEFNQEIRESKRFLTSICEAEYVNEASSAVDFSNPLFLAPPAEPSWASIISYFQSLSFISCLIMFSVLSVQLSQIK